MSSFQTKQFNVDIYGNGTTEYEGFFLVIMTEFDECDKPTGRRKSCYVSKGENIGIIALERQIKRIIPTLWGGRNNEKYFIDTVGVVMVLK